jgi:hypothetical protein
MKKLTIVTLLYISAPTLFFLFFWLKPAYAFISVGCLIFAFILSVKNLPVDDELAMDSGRFRIIFISSFLMAISTCLFSEFGVLPYQSYDYVAHNFKFNLLATQPLPLFDEDRQIYMCYYLGNYIVPALLGKVTSIGLIKTYFFFWCAWGVGLTFIWIQIRFIHLSALKSILICLSLVIGSYVCIILPTLHFLIPNTPFLDKNSVSVNGKFFLNQIPIFTRNLSESPQHTLPAILGIAFLLAIFNKRAYFFASCYLFLATLFMAPLVAIGLIGYMVYIFIKHLKNEGKEFFVRCLLFGIPLLIAYLPVILYLTSSEATDMQSNRAIWQAGSSNWFAYYILYLASTYGIWFLFFGKRLLEFDRPVVIISCLFLAVVSLFQIGFYNDLNIRSAMVPQLVFGIGIGYVLVTHRKLFFKNFLFTTGALFWILNCVSPAKFYYDRFFVIKGERNTIENPLIPGYGTSYYDLLKKSYAANSDEVIKQYALRNGSVFTEYLLKR